jgi:large subunit ribosomal protein L46
VLPFTRYHYFNQKTPELVDFQRQIGARKTPARDIGVYDAYGRLGWNDEVLVGDQAAHKESGMKAILGDEIVEVGAVEREKALAEQEGVEVEGIEMELEKGVPSVSTRPMSRRTKADETEDTKSLDRALQRTLYLVVKGEDGWWKFPSKPLIKKENVRAVSWTTPIQIQPNNLGCPPSLGRNRWY